ncbi:MAG: TadE/TadG family type IV pilus assembly protein [Pseudomonadota bacterium]
MTVFRAFWSDDRGSLTVEFVLWVPVLLIWLMASIAWFDAWLARNQAAKVAYTVSDILSRQEEVTGGFLMQIDTLQRGLLTRADGAAAMRLSSIQRTSTGHEVRWSCSNAPSLQPLTDGNLPTADLPDMATLETIVLTELAVPWSGFDWAVGLGALTWTYRVPSRPRFTPMLAMIGDC